MLFGLRQFSRKNLWNVLFLPMFVFVFVVVRHIPDKVRSQLLPQDVYLHLVKDFSS